MSCFLSIFKFKPTITEDEKNLKRYEEAMARDLLNDGNDEETPRKKGLDLSWIYLDIRSRIVFGILIAIFIGIGIPLIVYFADKPGEPRIIYGSCLLRQEYKVKCLANQITDPTENECIAAKCCWNDNATLPFHCFHSLSPAYQYYVTTLRETQSEFTELKKIELNLRPNLIDRMKNLQVEIEWKSLEHLNVQIYDPTTTSRSGAASIANENGELLEFGSRDAEMKSPQFILNYATEDDYFYLAIKRNSSNEILFDTRLGPLVASTNDFISFVTALPTPFFYGLRGGISGGGEFYDNFQKYGQADFPFYLALESSGNSYGLLLETIAPFTTQYMEAPGLAFHVESKELMLNLHFFVGPTVKAVYHQLHLYLKSKQDESIAPTIHMPPYWALGLHICRSAIDEGNALLQIQNLHESSFVYDSDCVDENLRTPFLIDEKRYPAHLQEITKVLSEKKQMILLSQKVVLPNATIELTSEHKLIMKNETHPLIGFADPEHLIYYPDYLVAESSSWLDSEFTNLTENELFGGLIIEDNYPQTFVPSSGPGICLVNATTRLEQSFLTPTATERNESVICPESLHIISSEITKTHFEVHNSYGHESLLKIRAAFETSMEALTNQRFVFTSSSVWINSLYSGGFNGPEVPFTWDGMIDSLAYILRNFMFFIYVGTPICGSYLPADMNPSDTNELCFRWFQLGLLLPFARNTYRTDGTKGPLDLSAAYLNRVVNNTQERYKYNPYYYTLFYEYEISEAPEPPIRPMTFDFPQISSNVTFRILTQFMIGKALMAAPVLTRSSQREAYFPPGTWYNLAGKLQWSNEEEGGILTVEGYVSELPIYLRSGFIIPALEEPVLLGNAMESREGNYSIIGALPPPGQESKGSFFVDDGLELNSTQNNNYDFLTFTMTPLTLKIETKCDLKSETTVALSKRINQIKIFGLPSEPESIVDVTKIFDGTRTDDQVESDYDNEYKVLYLRNLDIKWCIDFHEVNFKWTLRPESTTTSNT